jgi:hydrogenase assembly chaperone HypC/HupF
MCLMLPSRVVAIEDEVAIVETGANRSTANRLMAPELAVGDWVVVAGGAIVRRVSAEAARAMAHALRDASAPTVEPSELMP